MRESVRQAFAGAVERFEGRTTWPYLDVKSLVTVGVGNLIDPVSLSLPLPWLNADGTPASEEEIRNDWWRVKGTPSLAVRGAQAARSVARLHLAEDAVDALVDAKRDEFWGHLLQRFTGAESWPADAQLGLLLMAWALGPHFGATWPKFSAACLAGDWNAAAVECDITGARTSRNDAHRLCFVNAAASLDPEVLVFPADARAEVLG